MWLLIIELQEFFVCLCPVANIDGRCLHTVPLHFHFLCCWWSPGNPLSTCDTCWGTVLNLIYLCCSYSRELFTCNAQTLNQELRFPWLRCQDSTNQHGRHVIVAIITILWMICPTCYQLGEILLACSVRIPPWSIQHIVEHWQGIFDDAWGWIQDVEGDGVQICTHDDYSEEPVMGFKCEDGQFCR